jgi:hypothetical protein
MVFIGRVRARVKKGAFHRLLKLKKDREGKLLWTSHTTKMLYIHPFFFLAPHRNRLINTTKHKPKSGERERKSKVCVIFFYTRMNKYNNSNNKKVKDEKRPQNARKYHKNSTNIIHQASGGEKPMGEKRTFFSGFCVL